MSSAVRGTAARPTNHERTRRRNVAVHVAGAGDGPTGCQAPPRLRRPSIAPDPPLRAPSAGSSRCSAPHVHWRARGRDVELRHGADPTCATGGPRVAPSAPLAPTVAILAPQSARA
jgi:hypothetical protein